MNALLAELGYPPLAKDVVGAMIGKGMANLVRRALALATGVSPAAVDDGEVKDALRSLPGALRVAPRPRDAAVSGHGRGARRGSPRWAFRWRSITNKATRFVRPHLVQAGIERYFAVVVGGDDLPTKKPDPGPLLHAAAAFGIPPCRLLMVGDSANDVEAARGAGCPVLVVPYGYREGAPVHDLEADGIVASLDAVADRVRYVAPDTAMSFDLFDRNGRRGPAPVAARGRRAPLAPLTARAPASRATRCAAQSRDCTVARVEEIVEAP